MAIDRAEVLRVAALARLDIPEDDVERVARQLSEVLDYVAALRDLDLAGCEPATLTRSEEALRPDRIDGRCLPTEVALAAAPASEGPFFLVPPIVENVNP